MEVSPQRPIYAYYVPRHFRHTLVPWFWRLWFLCTLVACGTAPNDPITLPELPPITTITTPDTITIALVMKTLTNPFFIEMEKGARRAEAELGITLIVKTAAQETSIEQQIQIVADLIQQQVAAIVIAPGDSLELIPILKQAQDAGIVVINIDNRLDANYSAAVGLTNVPFISVNNEAAAYLSAKYISDQLPSAAEVAILEGIRGAQNAEDRKAGAMRAFAENPNLHLVGSETANWKIDEGYEVTQALFREHPQIAALFCANDMMALGAIKFLQDTGRSNVLVAAYDALNEARQAIREGTLAATVDQRAAEQGYLGVVYAWQKLNGETLPAETLLDVRLITAVNVDDANE